MCSVLEFNWNYSRHKCLSLHNPHATQCPMVKLAAAVITGYTENWVWFCVLYRVVILVECTLMASWNGKKPPTKQSEVLWDIWVIFTLLSPKCWTFTISITFNCFRNYLVTLKTRILENRQSDSSVIPCFNLSPQTHFPCTLPYSLAAFVTSRLQCI